MGASARTALAAALSLALLWYTLRDVEPGLVLGRLAEAPAGYVALSLALEAAIVTLLSQRWRLILRSSGCEVTLGEAVRIYLGASPAEVVLPLKSSDLIKANYLRVTRGLPFAAGVSTVLLDNVLDLAAMVSVSALGLALSGAAVHAQAAAGLAAVGAFVVAAAAASRELDHPVFASFRAMGLRSGAELFALSLAVWLAVCANVSTFFAMVGMAVPFQVVMLYLPPTIVLAALPVTVGGLGSVEWCMLAFYAPFGASEAIIAADIVQRLVSAGLPMALGAPFAGRVMWPEGGEARGAGEEAGRVAGEAESGGAGAAGHGRARVGPAGGAAGGGPERGSAGAGREASRGGGGRGR